MTQMHNNLCYPCLATILLYMNKCSQNPACEVCSMTLFTVYSFCSLCFSSTEVEKSKKYQALHVSSCDSQHNFIAIFILKLKKKLPGMLKQIVLVNFHFEAMELISQEVNRMSIYHL